MQATRESTMTTLASDASVIEINKLSKQFKVGFLANQRFDALSEVTFSVRQGVAFGFLGPNGAGKTTTIKILNALIFASSGEAKVLGGNPSDASVRARMGYLPENPSFPDHLSGEEVLAFSCHLLKMPAKEHQRAIDKALELVKLTKARKLQVRRYSKGMTQRLGIAQAIIHDPELVILDEPMSGLDPVGRRDVKDLMLELRRKGRSVFFSTHIISDVEEICDDVAMIVGGKLVRQGAVSSLIGAEGREVEVLASGVPDHFPGRLVPEGKGITPLRAKDSQAARTMLEGLWAAGATVVSMRVLRYGLEDIFIEEVGRGPKGRHIEEAL